MPQYVILTHDHPFLHWDLLLEKEGVLKTWRLLKEPDSQSRIEVEALPDHRVHYLDYEGPVSGDRGTVSQWDKGNYEILSEENDQLELKLVGQKMNSVARIVKEETKSFILIQ